ncbi:placenta-specific protein 9 [Ctenodactylus gundi]
MRPLLCALAGLVLLPAAAEPLSPSQGDPTWSTGCDRHLAILSRLDVIEETVQKTAEHLEAEVKGLLDLLEALAWNLPPEPMSPTPDLLGDARTPTRLRARFLTGCAWVLLHRDRQDTAVPTGQTPEAEILMRAALLLPPWPQESSSTA